MFNTFWTHVMERIHQQLQAMQVDAAHAVVLLPFLQLVPVARVQWVKRYPNSFTPRFETTNSWAQRLRPFEAGENDITFDAGRDILTAQRLLKQAHIGQDKSAPRLDGRLLEAALQLAPVAAAQAPAQRAQWFQSKLAELLGAYDMSKTLHYEQAIASLACTWAGYSSYATDALFYALEHAFEHGEPFALLLVRGLQDDWLAPKLLEYAQSLHPQSACEIEWPQALQQGDYAQWQAARVHTAKDPEDEAQLAAACVQEAVKKFAMAQSGAEKDMRVVALVDNDRALTRRISALLANQKLAIRDETGWKLSTTVAASHVMLLLEAGSYQAQSDDVLAWLKLLASATQVWALQNTEQEGANGDAQGDVPSAQKNALFIDPKRVDTIEAYLRDKQLPQWPQGKKGNALWKEWQSDQESKGNFAKVDAAKAALRVNVLRSKLQNARSLHAWLTDLQGLLQTTGQWQVLLNDKAGQGVLSALHLPSHAQHSAPEWAETDPLSLYAFRQWVQQVLEVASFKPDYPLQEQIAIVPPSQLLARHFAAVVMPACDEQRLPAVPAPTGIWTADQRRLLGLPSKEQMQQTQRKVWEHVLLFKELDLLFSQSNGTNALQPSPLLLEWELQGSKPYAGQNTLRRLQDASQNPENDPRQQCPITPHGVDGAHAVVRDALQVHSLSASAYGKLLKCPYQFFVLSMLRLAEVKELQGGVEKNDYGTWLHLVLELFHKDLAENTPNTLPDDATLVQMLDKYAQQAQEELRLDDADMLPYRSAWPQVRGGYIGWLKDDFAITQARFESGEGAYQADLTEVLNALVPAEEQHELPPYPVEIKGYIDRVDQLPQRVVKGADDATDHADKEARTHRVIDYKTGKTADEMQLAFYAALMMPQKVQATFLKIDEKGVVKEDAGKTDALDAAPQLVNGIAQNLSRIAQGTPLHALGSGSVCDYCPAMGICRKRFWAEAQTEAQVEK